MGSDILEIRAHVREMIEADRAMLAPVEAQLAAQGAPETAEARWVLKRLAATLKTHIDELSLHLRRLGADVSARGDAGGTLASDLMNRASHSLNSASLAGSLRNYYTALSLAHAAELLLETTARAHGYSSTAALATRHREEISTVLTRIREMLPAAIKEEIGQTQVAADV